MGYNVSGEVLLRFIDYRPTMFLCFPPGETELNTVKVSRRVEVLRDVLLDSRVSIDVTSTRDGRVRMEGVKECPCIGSREKLYGRRLFGDLVPQKSHRLGSVSSIFET